MNPGPRLLLPPEVVARISWGAIFAGTMFTLALSAFVRWRRPPVGNVAVELVWIAVGIAVAGLVASHAVARLPSTTDPTQAFNRLVTRLALCEAGALMGTVTWLFGGDLGSLAAAAIGLLGIAVAFPRTPTVQATPGGPRNRMIR